ncbi:type VI secretion system-associated protein TagF [Rhodanobacter sp. IGA1.0]|uniref:Type VI secretion system-associated protein TagF n=1 Tax=Rhodanobacter sp. IGA1.0 TaxID=3158582 RepID=A0AAU7QHT2_9GAMM
MPTSAAGFFGKLPCAGDFVQRRLPSAFVDVWDRHFEEAVAASRAELGSGWHDAYHASPVWRFLFAPGVCGDSAWFGIMGPGVDRVGRCFPMVIAAPLGVDIASGTRALTEAKAWSDAAEQVHAMAQCDARISVEAFDEQVAALGDPLARASSPAPTSLRDVDWNRAAHWRLPLGGASSPEPFLGEVWERLAAVPGPWCLWWTAGSERVPACVLATRGLPAASAYVTFLDAQHGAAAWQSPMTFERSVPRVAAVSGRADSLLDDLMAAAPAIPVSAMPSPPPTPSSAWLPDDPDLLADLVGTSEAATSVPPLPSVAPVAAQVTSAGEGEVVAAVTVVERTDCGLTVLSAEVGTADSRQRAVGEVSGIIRTMSCSDLIGGMHSLRRQLLMLNPPLRRASEDLIDPVLEDCAVIAAHVVAGQAGLLRIGAAGAWHWRHGRVQPLFAQADDPLPGGADDGEFDDLLFSSVVPGVPGLGASEQPLCGEVRCELVAGDRLLLMAGEPLLNLSPDVVASHLALPVDEARPRLANAAGLGVDAARWPLTIIEVGA